VRRAAVVTGGDPAPLAGGRRRRARDRTIHGAVRAVGEARLRSTTISDTHDGIHEFNEFRREANAKILDSGHLGIKRFFNLDTRAYEDGALDRRTKELCGLVASLVLRCDDCVTYHLGQCAEIGLTDPELHDALNVGLIVGGSIVIPHLRRAFARIEELRALAIPAASDASRADTTTDGES
jgi:AhpD family alkylhydroperoxidase